MNFVKSEIFKIWILWKVRFLKCEFLDKLRIFVPVCHLRSRVTFMIMPTIFCAIFRIEVVMSTMWLFRTIPSLCRILTKLFALNAHSRPKIRLSVFDRQVALVMEEKIMREASVWRKFCDMFWWPLVMLRYPWFIKLAWKSHIYDFWSN